MATSKHLPSDLVTEILVKLPAKSLVRFKCVARSWNALFRSHAFVTRHASSSSASERLMIFHNESRFRITLLRDDPSQPPEDLQMPFADKSLNYIVPYGPCNGIFCLYGYYRDNRCQLILWNPATREVKVVPPPHQRPSHDEFLRYGWEAGDCRYILHGFGVDPNTNDLKVVTLLMHDTPSHPSAEVYNLSTNSWTIIRDTVPATTIWYPEFNTHVNGVYHWLSGYPGDGREIICFDLGDHRFRKLKLPVAVHQSFGRDHIAEVNDSIAYVVMHFDWAPCNRPFEIWTLNRDGGGDSWSKMYNVGPIDGQRMLVRFYGVWKDGGEVLAGTPNQPLVSYNSDSQPVRKFQINVVQTIFRVHKYVVSMAPLSV